MLLSYSCTLLVIYFFYKNSLSEVNISDVLAIITISFYLSILYLVPPELPYTSKRIISLYTFVPLVSFGAILLPELNPRTPEKFTIYLGWLGLLIVLSALIYFKYIYKII